MRSGYRRPLEYVLVLSGIAALVTEALLRHRTDPPIAAAVVLAFATCAPWLWHERFPLSTLLVVGVGLIACVLVFHTYDSATAAAAVALFSVALSGDRRRSLLVGGLAAIVLTALLAAMFGVLEHHDDLSGGTTRVLLALGALAVGDLVRSRRALRAAAREQAELEARELRERGDRQAAAERLRIARELHDTLAHALVAINVRAGVSAHLGASEDSGRALTEIKEVSAQALTDLRATLDVLRDQDSPAPRAPAAGLEEIPRLITQARATGLKTGTDLRLNGTAIPSLVGQVGFRIVQESLTNVMRHAHAHETQVTVAARGHELVIEVTDDGDGGAVDSRLADADADGGGLGAGGHEVGGHETGGHGLRGMSERVAAVGGQMRAGPLTGRGWRVHATLPLSGNQR